MHDREGTEENGMIRKVSPSVSKLLDSSCVITSPANVVKELLDNALDAKATNVEIRLESFGLNRIEVRDNGVGISAVDARFAALCYFTSKLRSDDLSSVLTFGFRGVALSSICQTGKLSILTKCEKESVGRVYHYNKDGEIESENFGAVNRGTVVIVTDLFRNLPVRKQYYNNANKKKEVLKSVENILRSYAIIMHDLRLSLYHDKHVIWQKSPTTDIRKALHQQFDVLLKDHLEEIYYANPVSSEFSMMCILPKRNSNVRITSRSQPNVIFVYVNKRPVRMKSVYQLVKQYYNIGHSLSGGQGRYPCCVISIDVSTKLVDINVEPDKGTIYFESEIQTEILEALETILKNLYEAEVKAVTANSLVSANDIKADAENSASYFPQLSNENVKRTQKSELILRDKAVTEAVVDSECGMKRQISVNTETIGRIEQDSCRRQIQDNTERISEPEENWSRGQIYDDSGKLIEGASLLSGKRSCQVLNNDIVEVKRRQMGDKVCESQVEIIRKSTSESSIDKFLSPSQGCHTSSKTKANKCSSFKVGGSKSHASSRVNTEINQKSLLEFTVTTSSKSDSVSAANTISFSLHKLLPPSNEKDNVGKEDNILLIGCLDNGFWIVCQAQTLAVLNHHRLQESVLFHKLMATHRIATEPLPIPEVITESKLGRAAMSTLLLLSSKMENEYVSTIDDERICKNGLSLTTTEGHDGITTVNLMGFANHITDYSLSDLQEILHCITLNPNVNLYNCRPRKVKFYLKNEAVRMNSVHSLLMSRENIKELIANAEIWLPDDQRHSCLHGNPFYEPLYFIT